MDMKEWKAMINPTQASADDANEAFQAMEEMWATYPGLYHGHPELTSINSSNMTPNEVVALLGRWVMARDEYLRAQDGETLVGMFRNKGLIQ